MSAVTVTHVVAAAPAFRVREGAGHKRRRRVRCELLSMSDPSGGYAVALLDPSHRLLDAISPPLPRLRHRLRENDPDNKNTPLYSPRMYRCAPARPSPLDLGPRRQHSGSPRSRRLQPRSAWRNTARFVSNLETGTRTVAQRRSPRSPSRAPFASWGVRSSRPAVHVVEGRHDVMRGRAVADVVAASSPVLPPTPPSTQRGISRRESLHRVVTPQPPWPRRPSEQQGDSDSPDTACDGDEISKSLVSSCR